MVYKILVLGAGMVSGPCVEYLLRQQHAVTVVSAVQEELARITKAYPTVGAVKLDVSQNTRELQGLVSEHDLSMSLLPSHLHSLVVSCCLESRKSLVHASYESEEIKDAHEKAVEAGITILSEMGLDPGIDHMLAMDCIDKIRETGGQVTGYLSMCGGIPAPECSHGPLRYKFSWYPKGMFISASKVAKYVQDGQLVMVPPGGIFDKPHIIPDLVDGYELEDLPNRDATVYREIYNLQSADTVYRGTLRYKGFCEGMKVLFSLGLTNAQVLPELLPDSPPLTWRELVCTLLELPVTSSLEQVISCLHRKHELNMEPPDLLEGLGLWSDELVPKLSTPVDALASHLAIRLAYDPSERDLVVMRNVIKALSASGQPQVFTYNLLELGQDQGYSAMARTVGLTAAIGADLVVRGEIRRCGALLPVTPDIYRPVLDALTKEGIHIETKITSLAE